MGPLPLHAIFVEMLLAPDDIMQKQGVLAADLKHMCCTKGSMPQHKQDIRDSRFDSNIKQYLQIYQSQCSREQHVLGNTERLLLICVHVMY